MRDIYGSVSLNETYRNETPRKLEVSQTSRKIWGEHICPAVNREGGSIRLWVYGPANQGHRGGNGSKEGPTGFRRKHERSFKEADVEARRAPPESWRQKEVMS